MTYLKHNMYRYYTFLYNKLVKLLFKLEFFASIRKYFFMNLSKIKGSIHMYEIAVPQVASILSVLILAFGLTSLITGMFEMMRSGFKLTLHMILNALATLGSIAVWLTIFLAPDLFFYAVVFTVLFAFLAIIAWMRVFVFGQLIIFRTMQFSSIHMSHLSHLLILFILSIAGLFVFKVI